MKHSSIAAILIQVFVLSAMVGALFPTVSAANNDANVAQSNLVSPEFPSREDIGSDWLDSADDFKPEFAAGEVLVKFRTGLSAGLANGLVTTGIKSIDRLNEQVKVRGITKVFSNVYKLALPEDADVLSVAREYEADPNVEYAEPNGIYRTCVVPNDENYAQQWAHNKTQSEYAWNVTTGDPDVVIAIVDTGVDYNHTDLEANIWINTDEIPDNGIDDDNNGFIDDVRGWDFVDVSEPVYPGEDGTEPDNDPMDFYGHGTHCSGIAAAVTNNGIGIAGMTWNSKIMAVRSGYKRSDGRGALMWDHSAAGIRYAVDNGADIISMSFGGYVESEVVYDAVKYAYDNGVLLVASAGNSKSSIKSYPAAYEEVVAVTATDQYDDPANFHNWGTNFGSWVEVAAPGVDILSTVPRSFGYLYDYGSGTSMAAPHVAGVAALILSRFPDLTRDQVRVQLRRTADDLGDEGFDIYYGYGRINASGAVNQDIPDHDLLVLSWKLPFVSEPGEPATVKTTVFNFGDRYEWWIRVKLLVNGTEKDSEIIFFMWSGESETVSFSWTPTAEGTYNVTTYVVPESGEEDIDNNAQSAYSWVRYGKAVNVPEDFPTIKEAIDITNREVYGGDATIQVSNGTYDEGYLAIQNKLKSLTLAGESSSNTILSYRSIIGVSVFADNVTIKGFTIRNYVAMGGSVGIYLLGHNCVISDNKLIHNGYGIDAWFCSNNIIRDNIVSENKKFGIRLSYSSGDTLINNTLTGNTYGILLSLSEDAVLTNNALTGNTYGFGVEGETIYYIIFNQTKDEINNYESFGVESETLSHFIHDIDTTNTVDGKPIYYLVNQSNLVVEPSTFPNIGYLAIVNSTGVTVRNLTLSNNWQGVLFAYTKNSTLQNVNVSNNFYGIYSVKSKNNTYGNSAIDNTMLDGIYLSDSDNNTISGNTLSNITGHGIILILSDNNTVGNNNVPSCCLAAIYLLGCTKNSIDSNLITSIEPMQVNYSDDNIIRDNRILSQEGIGMFFSDSNTIVNNTIGPIGIFGIALFNCSENSIDCNFISGFYWGGHGIDGIGSSGNIIRGNMFSDLGSGIYFDECKNNTIVENCMMSSNPMYYTYAIFLTNSSNNVIHHNNFINNKQQVYIPTSGYANVWDDGYPSGGNYWSDYTGQDLDGDGIGDTPYVIDANNRDNYPLMHPWGAIRNIDTGLPYLTIQQAIDASETEDGHTILVDAGTYYEHVSVHKSLNLQGEDRDTTIIDGDGSGTIMSITADSVNITGFTVRNGEYGILLSYSSNNGISGNTIANNDYGICMRYSHNNTVSGNTITNSDDGIQLFSSNNNSIDGNVLTEILNFGIQLSHSDNNTVCSNTVINGDTGIPLFNSDNNTVCSNNINSTMGIQLFNSNKNSIDGNTITGIGVNGIILHTNSIGNTIRGNTIINYADAISLLGTCNNTVCNNTLTSNSRGISLLDSNKNFVEDNILTDIILVSIYIDQSYNNTVCGNTITNSTYGIMLFDAGNNTIAENLVSYNDYGIFIADSGNNAIHHNNFISNTEQTFIIGLCNNMWISVNFVGNYWSDYTGNDTICGGNGIGDTPYVIAGDNNDTYPLMWKWFPGDLDGDGDVDQYDSGYFGDAYGSYVGDENYEPCCDLDEDGDVDGADLSRIGAAYGSKPGDPNWDEACDINKDGVVDDADLDIAGDAYGSEGDPRYNKLADLDYDGDVDEDDLDIFNDNYGKSW